MFNQLFFRSDALTRQLSAQLVDERRQYLAQCAAQGMSKHTLRMKARLLLSIAEYLRLAKRPNDTITLLEIKKAASRWSSHNWPSQESSQAKRSREYFIAQATKWMTFLNRFQIPPKPVTVYDQMLAEFRAFMEEDRGLAPATVKGCCSSVRPFLIQLLDGRRSLQTITVSDVDSLLEQKVNKEHYARVSVRDYASSESGTESGTDGTLLGAPAFVFSRLGILTFPSRPAVRSRSNVTTNYDVDNAIFPCYHSECFVEATIACRPADLPFPLFCQL